MNSPSQRNIILVKEFRNAENQIIYLVKRLQHAEFKYIYIARGYLTAFLKMNLLYKYFRDI
jgi:hypothetical protein